MKTYLDLLQQVLDHGQLRRDRTGTGTYSLFGAQLRFSLTNAFPLLTTKRVHWKSVVYELLWFLRGDTNIRWLNENGVTIWDEWADTDGNLGRVYGAQWRSWRGADGREVDQIEWVTREIRNNPESRRLVVSAWNPSEIDSMALPPCHALFQFYVRKGHLSCQLYQRSADLFLGVPFNIASYALLTCLMARTTGLLPGEFVHTFGDVHLYTNHVDQAREQLNRQPRPLPTLKIHSARPTLDAYEFTDLELIGYDPYPAIRAPIAV